MTVSVSFRIGPRRLMTSTTMPPSAERTPSRSVAGEASVALASGRTSRNSVSVACAARCSLRSASARTCCCQKHERAATSRSKHLLGAPEGVGRAGCAQLHQLLKRQSQIGKRERIRHMRRLQQRNRPIADFGQRRAQQAEFSDARLLHQQFDECAERPAASRQLGRQGGITRVDRLSVRTGELRPAPQRGVY